MLKGREKIAVPATLRDLSTYAALEREDWLEPEADFIRSLARPGLRAIDIGTDAGICAVLLATGAGPTGSVWAFAAGGNAQRLHRSIAANGLENVTVVERALAGGTGSATLDGLAETAALRGIDFVRLPAAGTDALVLSGGERFFRDESPLIMMKLKQGVVVQRELLSRLAGLGYRFWRFVPGLQRLVPLDGDETDFSSLNVFAAKDDRAQRLAAEGKLVIIGDDAPDAGTRFPEFFATTEFGRRWTREMGALDAWPGRPDTHSYRVALDLYAAARDETAPPAVRFACLRESFRRLGALCDQAPDIPAFLSLARVAHDLGLHEDALRAVSVLFGHLSRGEEIPTSEPFLPLAPRFEAPPANAGMGAWIAAMVVEAYRDSLYATGYGSRECFELTEYMFHLGAGTPRLERSRQLYRISAGLQAGPVMSDILAAEPAATLNLDFWRGTLAAV